MNKRHKTSYPGVYYRETKRVGGRGTEKVYYIVFKKDGKTREEKAGRQYADDMTPAKAARIRGERIEGRRLSRKELRDQERAEKETVASRWTIARLWNEYIQERPQNHALITDKNRYKHYIEVNFGPKEPKEITPLEVDRLRINLLKKKSPQTVKHILNLLTWIINYGVKRNLCEPLPFHIKKPEVNNQTTEDLTTEQMRALLKAIDEDENIQAANLMKLALFTGMRRGELLKLRWDDIDFERGFIRIRDPKGKTDQSIPLNGPARNVLESHVRTDSVFVFPGQEGKQRKSINKQVNRIKERAGLPKDFRPLHGLRHAYASILASSGQVDLYTLQKLLTHKSPVMTQRYAHLRDEALRRASDLAGQLLSDNGSQKAKVVKLEGTSGGQ